MPTQHFIIEGKYLGSTERGARYVHGQKQTPTSYAFFCPVCAALWATCPLELTEGKPEHFMVWTVPCRKHYHHAFVVPGSIHLSWDNEFTESFPRELLKWELERHLDFCELPERI